MNTILHPTYTLACPPVNSRVPLFADVVEAFGDCPPKPEMMSDPRSVILAPVSTEPGISKVLLPTTRASLVFSSDTGVLLTVINSPGVIVLPSTTNGLSAIDKESLEEIRLAMAIRLVPAMRLPFEAIVKGIPEIVVAGPPSERVWDPMTTTPD